MSLWQVWGKYHSLPSNDRPLDVSWYQASHQLIPADTWFNPHLCSECRHFGHTSRSRYLLTLNSLPPAVFNSISLSLSTFKSRLKTHLFSTTQPACSAGASVADNGITALYKFSIIIIIIIIITYLLPTHLQCTCSMKEINSASKQIKFFKGL